MNFPDPLSDPRSDPIESAREICEGCDVDLATETHDPRCPYLLGKEDADDDRTRTDA